MSENKKCSCTPDKEMSYAGTENCIYKCKEPSKCFTESKCLAKRFDKQFELVPFSFPKNLQDFGALAGIIGLVISLPIIGFFYTKYREKDLCEILITVIILILFVFSVLCIIQVKRMRKYIKNIFKCYNDIYNYADNIYKYAKANLDLKEELGLSCSKELAKKVKEFRMSIDLNPNMYLKTTSRAEYLKMAKEARENEIKSYQIMYLNASAVYVYLKEAADWLNEPKSKNPKKRHRIILIEDEDWEKDYFNFKKDVNGILNTIKKHAIIRVCFVESFADNFDDKSKAELLKKDFGIFIVNGNSYMSFFTSLDLCFENVQRMFTLATGDYFVITGNNDFIGQHIGAFDSVWGRLKPVDQFLQEHKD